MHVRDRCPLRKTRTDRPRVYSMCRMYAYVCLSTGTLCIDTRTCNRCKLVHHSPRQTDRDIAHIATTDWASEQVQIDNHNGTYMDINTLG